MLSSATINSINALEPDIDYTALAASQQVDEEMAAYRIAIFGQVLEDVCFGPSNSTLLCDVSTGHPTPIIPASWRRRIFDAVHRLAHPSKTKTLIAAKFMWHGLHRDDGN